MPRIIAIVKPAPSGVAKKSVLRVDLATCRSSSMQSADFAGQERTSATNQPLARSGIRREPGVSHIGCVESEGLRP